MRLISQLRARGDGTSMGHPGTRRVRSRQSVPDDEQSSGDKILVSRMRSLCRNRAVDFVENEDEWENQEEDKDDVYYDGRGHFFGDAGVRFKFVCPPLHLVDDELVQRFFN